MITNPRQPRRAPLPLRAAAPAALACGLALVLGTAQPAAAHAGVTASDPRALAKNVTVTLTSEAESAKAGITKIQVVLPQGLSPAAVTLKNAPKGWKFIHSQGGYTVHGTALPTGTDAVHSIAVQQLPDAKELIFRVLETYSDGSVSRWIEDPGVDGSDSPAPVLKLKAKAPGAVKVPIDPALVATDPPAKEPAPAVTPAPSAAVPPAPAEAPTATASPFPSARPTEGGSPTGATAMTSTADDDGGNGPVIAAVAGVAVLLAAGGFVAYRRRSSGS
ncbi:DUF1775 domain-containing protein [Streptomyces sp. NPDC094448]|uniref:DUF1775 domain-containing protein n=1 Tax=Streptomyces sp. NPDC094448 TaxID=3366063 RepID=UPI0038152C5D